MVEIIQVGKDSSPSLRVGREGDLGSVEVVLGVEARVRRWEGVGLADERVGDHVLEAVERLLEAEGEAATAERRGPKTRLDLPTT